MPVLKQPADCDIHKDKEDNCDKKEVYDECEKKEICEKDHKKNNPLNLLFGDLFKSFEIDDIILIGLIILLLTEGEDDWIMIALLAVVFLF